ncbi:MAG: hypothetical protein K0U23_00865, partial [Gammaproteobacteria bacterium]|nr:hypothetical protein [Gammaproteobacteria bacterium]
MDVSVFSRSLENMREALHKHPTSIDRQRIREDFYDFSAGDGQPYSLDNYIPRRILFDPLSLNFDIAPNLVVEIMQKNSYHASIGKASFADTGMHGAHQVHVAEAAPGGVSETCYYLPFADYRITCMRLPKHGQQR